MKYLFFIALFVSMAVNAQDVNRLRAVYPEAVENAEINAGLYDELEGVSASSKAILAAYKGAVSTIKAKFAKSRKDKKDYFKDGVSLIESAIVAEPSNIEIHYLRLSVQENSPRFLGYHKNIEEDKQFIMSNYKAVSSSALKEAIKNFVMNSKSFEETEKAMF